MADTSGELDGLAFLVEPARDGVRAYRGGVLYTVFGASGFELGGRPSSLRWAGVRGISDMSSGFRRRGAQAMPTFQTGNMETMMNDHVR